MAFKKSTSPQQTDGTSGWRDSSKSKEAPLRSKVVLTKPYVTSGDKFIRLDVYHDTTDVRKVLKKIQECCDYGLNEEEEIGRMTAKCPQVISGPWLETSRSETPSLSLNDLSADILLRCLTFCDLRSLGTVSSVSSRFSVLTNTYYLWETQANVLHVKLKDPREARKELKANLLAKKRAKEREVEECESEYELLSQRMKARTEAIRSDPVNVEETLRGSTLDGVLKKSFSKESGGGLLVSTSFITKMQETLAALEELRSDAMNKMERNDRKLTQQQEQLLMIEQRLCGKRESASAEESTTECQITLPKLIAFERRMVRLVLSGSNLATATQGTSSCVGGRDTLNELPVVLRRGIQDFGTLEILSIDTSLPAAILKPIQKRFTALKRFFPLSDDYYTVKTILESNAVCNDDSLRGSKQRPAMVKIASLIHRIQTMKDPEVLSVVL